MIERDMNKKMNEKRREEETERGLSTSDCFFSCVSDQQGKINSSLVVLLWSGSESLATSIG